MKKKVENETLPYILSVAFFLGFLALVYVSFPTKENDISAFNIPTGRSMAKVAMDVQTESVSFNELHRRIVVTIKDAASRGARSTEEYVGDFSAETVKEMERQLAFSGYKTQLRSALSGTNNFLEITW